MLRGTQQRGPVRLVQQDESTLQQTSALGYGLILAGLVVVMPFLAIGFAWAMVYVVRAAGVVALVWKALLT